MDNKKLDKIVEIGKKIQKLNEELKAVISEIDEIDDIVIDDATKMLILFKGHITYSKNDITKEATTKVNEYRVMNMGYNELVELKAKEEQITKDLLEVGNYIMDRLFVNPKQS